MDVVITVEKVEAPHMYWPHIWWLNQAVTRGSIVISVDYMLRCLSIALIVA
jgi:hypothetical protein